MAELIVTITEPPFNTIVGTVFQISGTAEAIPDTDPREIARVTRVTVRLGHGPARPAAGSSSWSISATLPDNVTGGTGLEITATASGQVRLVGEMEWRPIPPVSTSRSVRVENRPPLVSLDPYPLEVTAASLPYRLTLSGSAHDQDASVQAVTWKTSDGAFTAAENLTGDWSRWQAVIDLAAGEHQITIQAVDVLENSARVDITLHVRTPFQPPAADLAFAPTSYLLELMGFAERHIEIGTLGSGPTAGHLGETLFQPFDRLAAPEAYEAATRRLHQVRIAVEVLRRYMTQLGERIPPRIERQFRGAAYVSLLQHLDTSDEELRTARIADEATRRALAARLGFELEATRPDRLDSITVMPEQITAAQLEQLFGFERTTHPDPLRSVVFVADVLNWRVAALRQRWASEDDAVRDPHGGPVPIIDPDLIVESNLQSTAAGNRAYELWSARTAWLDATLADVRQARAQGLEHVIRTFIDDLDVPALARDDDAGIDITLVLNPLRLDLGAFRYLARCHALAAGGVVLDAEWLDIIDIIIQVQKQRQFQRWRREESGLVLSPEQFRPSDAVGVAMVGGSTVSRWRATWPAYTAWHRTLAARTGELEDAKKVYAGIVTEAETLSLPILRDALIEVIGQRQSPAERAPVAAARLSRELAFDFEANAAHMTTRVDQAIDTLLNALFSVRAGRLTETTSPLVDWRIEAEAEFDREWRWISSYGTWRAAMTIFAYPENQLFPSLYVREEPFLTPTRSFLELMAGLLRTIRLTPAAARDKAQEYLVSLRTEIPDLPPELRAAGFVITEDLELSARKALVTSLFSSVSEPHAEPAYLREVFLLVPIAMALRLQQAGHYLAALDWFQTVFAFNLGRSERKIYRGLEMEETIASVFSHIPEWLVEELNPHIFATSRKNAYTRFTVASIVRCFLAYADAEFSRNTAEAASRARTLYQSVEDLLSLPDVAMEEGEAVPFPPNPIWESLRLEARAGLAKIQNKMNFAGFAAATEGPPTQYRYSALADRAKQLVAIAQQVEASYLAALERRDAEAYSLLQAGRDLQVARATVNLHDLRIIEADLGVRMAELQRDKARIQAAYLDQQLRNGLNHWEERQLAALRSALRLQDAASALSIVGAGWGAVGLLGNVPLLGSLFGGPAQVLSAFSNTDSLRATLYQTLASFERRQEEWRHQAALSGNEIMISEQQMLLAENRRRIAVMEGEVAQLQLVHATSVVEFLVNKFTNAELYEWMSNVLGRVYNYFLQQATALAQLAQAQLSFERQEPALTVIQSDYWQAKEDSSANEPDRRGLTGSARLLQDIFSLDQYDFETRRRKLQLTQTVSVAQVAPLELQGLRETGQLRFVTPMELFDRDFPGHYLRLTRRVRPSIVALTPPVSGVRATLSASGLSRVVVGGEHFQTVELRHAPETMAFTSPINATGLFELEAESGMLLPFEGMGVHTSWELQLPKPANRFDYQTIADVLLTIEYTALSSPLYREQVIRQLGGRLTGDRLFSVREQFADAWYELNNSAVPVTQFATRRSDFAANFEELQIEHVTLRVLRQEGFTEEMSIEELTFTVEGDSAAVGGAARTVAGTVTTRRASGENWSGMRGKRPFGQWKLQLSLTEPVEAWLQDGLIEDLALVITFAATTSQWPA